MRNHETNSENLKRREPSGWSLMRFAINGIPISVRFSLKDLEKDYAKTEEDIKAVQSVGQIIGEVMKQLDDERCTSPCCFSIY
jgi:26S proteasome regulatory subunit T4